MFQKNLKNILNSSRSFFLYLRRWGISLPIKGSGTKVRQVYPGTASHTKTDLCVQDEQASKREDITFLSLSLGWTPPSPARSSRGPTILHVSTSLVFYTGPALQSARGKEHQLVEPHAHPRLRFPPLQRVKNLSDHHR